MADQEGSEPEENDETDAPAAEDESPTGRSFQVPLAETEGIRIWRDQVLGTYGMRRVFDDANLRRITQEFGRAALGTDRFMESIATSSGITNIHRRIAELTGASQFKDSVAAATESSDFQKRIAKHLLGTDRLRESIAAASGITDTYRRMAEIVGTAAFQESIAAASGAYQIQQRVSEALGLDRVNHKMAHVAGLNSPSDRLTDYVFKTKAVDEILAGFTVRMPLLDPNLGQRLRRAFERFLPRNLRGVDDIKIADLTKVMEDEGIPFCLVPDAETAVALLAAANAEERRGVLAARAEPIFDACEEILRLCVREDLAFTGSQIRAAIGAYRAGFSTAAQSLATTVLDSTFRANEAITHRDFVVGRKTLPGGLKGVNYLDTLELARSLALRPLVRVHARQTTDEPPLTYSRNATTHEVTPEQYTDANAIQAIMLATSILGFVQDLW